MCCKLIKLGIWHYKGSTGTGHCRVQGGIRLGITGWVCPKSTFGAASAEDLETLQAFTCSPSPGLHGPRCPGRAGAELGTGGGPGDSPVAAVTPWSRLHWCTAMEERPLGRARLLWAAAGGFPRRRRRRMVMKRKVQRGARAVLARGDVSAGHMGTARRCEPVTRFPSHGARASLANSKL